MEKISGIIPSSPRVTNVDMKDSANNTRVTLPNKVDPAGMRAETMGAEPGWKTKDAQHVAIVTNVANGFFMKKPEPEIEMEEPVPMEKPLPQPEGLFPKGSFIDRSA